MTNTQTKTVEFLESLVHGRFNTVQLNKKLSDFFKEEITIENNTRIRLENGDFDNEDDLTCDWKLIFNIENGTENSGFFDIYMLPMLKKGFDNEDMYITEIGYEFI